MSTVEYRGEQIKLSRWYLDYDLYKNDPNNILRSEVPRVQQLVRTAPPGPEIGTWDEVAGAALDIKFPGYGSGSLRSQWTTIRAFTFEVPQANEERVVVFRAENGRWRRIADLTTNGMPREVREVEGRVVLFDLAGSPIASRPSGSRPEVGLVKRDDQ